jgi:class 3 adenylate cyclase/TolB-like protein/Flp pilus assembly protein TadD
VPETSSAVPRRRLAAILFADVHGYSRLMAKNEDRTYERLTQSLRLMRSLLADYGGQHVRTAGDGVLALFETASQALKFAIAVQREFRNDAVWNTDDEPIVFRIGINLGEVLIDEADIQGHSVNIAARVQTLAQPGGICITEAVQRAVRDPLAATMRALGRRTLRNIDGPIDVFAVEIDGPELSIAPSGEIPQLPVLPSLTPREDAWIAVLPLENTSGDPRDTHLCDGITRDIITNLSRFRDLAVIAPYSAFLFRNGQLSPEEIGRHLGVGYLFTGGLERTGMKIRIRARLTETDAGQVLWSERFSGDLNDVFEFQDDVTDMIAARLAIQISAAERRRALARAPSELRAYGLVLRGQELSWHIRREANLHARRLFEQAAEIAPDYGRTYAAMSRTFLHEWRYGWVTSPEPCLDRAIAWAIEAITHDDLDARGYSELGYARLFQKQHEASIAAYERAIDLNPNDADVLAEMSLCLSYSGQSERAISLMNRALRLNPYFPDWYLWYLGNEYFDMGDCEKAVETLNKMRDKSEAHRLLTSSYALLGRMREARYHARQVLLVQPDFSIKHWRKVPPDRDAGTLDRFIMGLRKAGLK